MNDHYIQDKELVFPNEGTLLLNNENNFLSYQKSPQSPTSTIKNSQLINELQTHAPNHLCNYYKLENGRESVESFGFRNCVDFDQKEKLSSQFRSKHPILDCILFTILGFGVAVLVCVPLFVLYLLALGKLNWFSDMYTHYFKP